MKILHLTASPFFGGPERVILDVIRSQAAPGFGVESRIATFGENGGCEPFLRELDKAGFPGIRLRYDMPRLAAATLELIRLLRAERIDLLCAHGHKSRLLGWLASRRRGIPIVGVSHGWTWQDRKTSLYERLDQWVHHRMDRVVCVSQGQAEKVIRSGTPPSRVAVIHNAIDPARFEGPPDPAYRRRLEAMFETPPEVIVGAAGRLSPEKGFDILIDAAAITQTLTDKSFGVVLFGEGVLRESLERRIDAADGLSGRFKLPGFTSELDRFLPHFDLFAQSSHTEGFPCVNLEAMACGVPVVATSVGGVPEQIDSGRTGLLVPPDDPDALGRALAELVDDPERCRELGNGGRRRVLAEFTCREQARRYFDVFQASLKKST